MPLPESSLLDPEPVEPESLEPESVEDEDPPVEDVVPEVVAVPFVPAKRKPETRPVTAKLTTPTAVVMPTAACRPADRLSILGPSVRVEVWSQTGRRFFPHP